MASTLVLFDDFGYDLGNKVHNLASDTLKIVFTNSAPVQATGSVLSDITEITTAGGYTTGGYALDSVTWTETSAGSGVWRLSSADEVVTASGAAFDTFRYVVLYNDTATNNELIGYLDYGTAVNVADGSSFTVDVGTNGWFELTIP